MDEYKGGSHIFHHYETLNADKVRVKVEKNSRGLNYEVSVSGATVDEALELLRDAESKLRAEYGQTQ